MLILEGWTKPIIRKDRQTGGALEEVYEPKMKLLKTRPYYTPSFIPFSYTDI